MLEINIQLIFSVNVSSNVGLKINTYKSLLLNENRILQKIDFVYVLQFRVPTSALSFKEDVTSSFPTHSQLGTQFNNFVILYFYNFAHMHWLCSLKRRKKVFSQIYRLFTDESFLTDVRHYHYLLPKKIFCE